MTDSEYAELYRLYLRRVTLYLIKRGCPECSAEEFAHMGFIAGWKHIDQLDHAANFCCWIHTIARREWLNVVRTKQGRTQHIEIDAEHLTAHVTHTSTAPIHLAQILSLLTPEERRTLKEVYLNGLSFAELGQIMGCSANTAKIRVFRIRKKLRERMENRCIQP